MRNTKFAHQSSLSCKIHNLLLYRFWKRLRPDRSPSSFGTICFDWIYTYNLHFMAWKNNTLVSRPLKNRSHTYMFNKGFLYSNWLTVVQSGVIAFALPVKGIFLSQNLQFLRNFCANIAYLRRIWDLSVQKTKVWKTSVVATGSINSVTWVNESFFKMRNFLAHETNMESCISVINIKQKLETFSWNKNKCMLEPNC